MTKENKQWLENKIKEENKIYYYRRYYNLISNIPWTLQTGQI